MWAVCHEAVQNKNRIGILFGILNNELKIYSIIVTQIEQIDKCSEIYTKATRTVNKTFTLEVQIIQTKCNKCKETT